eukprot:TRINITY_DN1210_c0_g3_i3.p1 TRINITY_DN1210_c0_g3~~TRINITY_DN1210_c0_g3_i3.p1  ORF type:complete len:877 (+),score=282.64 TRINITY_DN1210_c0_g3_i3:126-2756(+)
MSQCGALHGAEAASGATRPPLSPCGTLLVAAGSDHVKIFSLSQPEQVIDGALASKCAVSCSEHIPSAGWGKRREPIFADPTATIHDLAFSPDGDWLALGCARRFVRLTEHDGEHPLIVAGFYDSNKHSQIRIKEVASADAPLGMAALGRTGLFLSSTKREEESEGEEEAPHRVHYRPLMAWGTSPEWTCGLPLGEVPLALAVGDTWAACFTTSYLRIWTHAGVELAVVSLAHRVVCAASYDGVIPASAELPYPPQDALAFVVQDAAGSYWLHVWGVRSGKEHEAAVEVPLSEGAQLLWLGWCGPPHEGMLATQDSEGVVRILVHRWGRQWVPVHDPRQAGAPKLHLLGMRDRTLRGAPVPEGRLRADPRSADAAAVPEKRELAVPVAGRGGMQREQEHILHRTLLAEEKKARLNYYSPDVAKLEVAVDQSLLKLFRQAIGGDEFASTARALDIAMSMNHREHLEQAMGLANSKHPNLYQKMVQILNANFPGSRTRKSKLPEKGKPTNEQRLLQQLMRYRQMEQRKELEDAPLAPAPEPLCSRAESEPAPKRVRFAEVQPEPQPAPVSPPQPPAAWDVRKSPPAAPAPPAPSPAAAEPAPAPADPEPPAVRSPPRPVFKAFSPFSPSRAAREDATNVGVAAVLASMGGTAKAKQPVEQPKAPEPAAPSPSAATPKRSREEKEQRKAEKRARREQKEQKRQAKAARAEARAANTEKGDAPAAPSPEQQSGDSSPAAASLDSGIGATPVQGAASPSTVAEQTPAAASMKLTSPDEGSPGESSPEPPPRPAAPPALLQPAQRGGDGLAKMMSFRRKAPPTPQYADGSLREVVVPERASAAASLAPVSADLSRAKEMAMKAAAAGGDSDSEDGPAAVTIRR